jgi:hypothetical protein
VLKHSAKCITGLHTAEYLASENQNSELEIDVTDLWRSKSVSLSVLEDSPISISC